MDPVSALGVAAAVVQFIQFGSSLASKATEIYKLSEAALAENIECDDASQRLKELCQKIKNANDDEVALKKVCEGCIEVAEELETLLWACLSISNTISSGSMKSNFKQSQITDTRKYRE